MPGAAGRREPVNPRLRFEPGAAGAGAGAGDTPAPASECLLTCGNMTPRVLRVLRVLNPRQSPPPYAPAATILVFEDGLIASLREYWASEQVGELSAAPADAWR